VKDDIGMDGGNAEREQRGHITPALAIASQQTVNPGGRGSPLVHVVGPEQAEQLDQQLPLALAERRCNVSSHSVTPSHSRWPLV